MTQKHEVVVLERIGGQGKTVYSGGSARLSAAIFDAVTLTLAEGRGTASVLEVRNGKVVRTALVRKGEVR
jgi:hypothetical protein